MTVSLSALRAGRPLPPGRFPVLISVISCVDLTAIMRLERLGQLRNPMTSSGLNPATFQLVAQCLNQLRNRVPHYNLEKDYFTNVLFKILHILLTFIFIYYIHKSIFPRNI
jgi:hypothetical protein